MNKAPVYYFMKYFTDDIFEKISNKTITYSLEVGGIFIKTNSLESRKFIGASIIMKNLKVPRIQDSHFKFPSPPPRHSAVRPHCVTGIYLFVQ